MGLKCTSRVEVEITYDALLEFVKKRLEGKELGDGVKFFVKGTGSEDEVVIAEVTDENPLSASYTEVSEV